VSCSNHGNINYWVRDWKFNYSKVRDHQGYLKSNDIINLSIKRSYDNNGICVQDGLNEFLRSHDVQFTIGNDTFQEVVCHNERLGGNDEVSCLFYYYYLRLYNIKKFFRFLVVH
jgi:hypothetical protein